MRGHIGVRHGVRGSSWFYEIFMGRDKLGKQLRTRRRGYRTKAEAEEALTKALGQQLFIELVPETRIQELEGVVESVRTQMATLFMNLSDLVEDSDKKLELLAQLRVILEGVENFKRESIHDQISAFREELTELALKVENLR